MNRREFIVVVGGAAAWPVAAWAQQAVMPVIGFLDPTSLNKYAPFVEALRQGLREIGFVEGQNVAIGFRWAESDYGRLPMMAAELVQQKVAVIVATGITAARAAKAATSTTPILFNTGGDPVKFGLVASLSRPGQNVTGVASLGKILVAKQLEMLHELVPQVDDVAFLVNPNNAVAGLDTMDVQAAANTLGKKLIVVKAGTKDELSQAFIEVVEQHSGALVVQTDPFFLGQRDEIVALAAHHAVPTKRLSCIGWFNELRWIACTGKRSRRVETPIWKTISLGTGMATSSSPANEYFDGPCAYFLEEEQFTFGASELLTLLLPLRST